MFMFSGSNLSAFISFRYFKNALLKRLDKWTNLPKFRQFRQFAANFLTMSNLWMENFQTLIYLIVYHVVVIN